VGCPTVLHKRGGAALFEILLDASENARRRNETLSGIFEHADRGEASGFGCPVVYLLQADLPSGTAWKTCGIWKVIDGNRPEALRLLVPQTNRRVASLPQIPFSVAKSSQRDADAGDVTAALRLNFQPENSDSNREIRKIRERASSADVIGATLPVKAAILITPCFLVYFAHFVKRLLLALSRMNRS
jgi:hypothetical protein